MPHATKQQLDAMAVADSLRPTLLRLARELRREKIGGVSPHQVGLLVARLERNGLVARTRSEADRRCIGLTLTEDGQRTLRRVRSRRTAWLASRLGTLTPTELAAVGAAAEPLARLLELAEGRA